MPSEYKTKNLSLNQWQGNEYAKRQDFVDDNKKIDDAIGELKNSIGNVKVPVTSVNNKDGDVVLKAKDITTEDDKTIEQNIKEVKSHLEDMKKIIVSETIPDVSKRVPNTIYCKITDVQSTNGTTNALKVSPTMGLKVEQ